MVYTISGSRLPSTVPSVYKLPGSSSHGERSNVNFSVFLRKHSFSGKFFGGKSSYDSDSTSFTIAASEKVLVPGSQSDGSSSLTKQLEVTDAALEDPLVSNDVDSLKMEGVSDIEDENNYVEPTIVHSEVEVEQDSGLSELLGDEGKAQEAETSAPFNDMISNETERVRKTSIPPPGTGQRIYEIDPLLRNYGEHLEYRIRISSGNSGILHVKSLDHFVNGNME
ncbi:unnamed protein product [Ilex paraguariensis]|uniref:Uncharacterized protein n=1 Tax=Ilex paraguariensis TaxID=185542 RepID=A0ABC8TFF8_9AQUA